MSDPQPATIKALCDNPNRSLADGQQCRAQAFADAVAAVKKCYLPLEPRRSIRNAEDLYRFLFRPESSPLECSRAELPVKTQTYHVRPFSPEEETEILYTGRKRAELGARNGERRPRTFLGHD